MNELPLWPPLVALVLGLLSYAWTVWASREFDRKYGPYLKPRDEDEKS